MFLGDFEFAQPFHVVGFSVMGRVVGEGGIGMPDVTIIVDAHEKAISDAQGFYLLDKVTK